jgi:hypothetical protein
MAEALAAMARLKTSRGWTRNAVGNKLHADEFAPRVEEDGLELFNGVGPIFLAQIIGDPFRTVQQRSFSLQFPGQAPGQRKGGLQGDGLGGANAFDGFQFIQRGAGQGIE